MPGKGVRFSSSHLRACVSNLSNALGELGSQLVSFRVELQPCPHYRYRLGASSIGTQQLSQFLMNPGVSLPQAERLPELLFRRDGVASVLLVHRRHEPGRSEEHTSELQ